VAGTLYTEGDVYVIGRAGNSQGKSRIQLAARQRLQVTLMNRDVKFWIWMTVFQISFGLVVFTITREYYMDDAANVSERPSTTNQAPLAPTDGISKFSQLSHSTLGESTSQDPVELSRQADQFFTNQQYDRAAALYERALALSPNNVSIQNELGLTLHYLGRSAEALRTLNEGVAADPKNQRIWLTLGFVNSQVGNIEQARTALTNATRIGTDESIRQSAMEMLKKLP